MTNERAMTLEDKIVQELKADTLGKLVDEDGLKKLVERAIREALYQPRVQGTGFNAERKDSPVVEAARKTADAMVTQVCAKIVEEALTDPALRKAVLDAFVVCLPQAFFAITEFQVRQAAHAEASDALTSVRMAFGQLGMHPTLYDRDPPRASG